MHYGKDFGIEVRIARFHNIYGPYGTWKGGREKAPAAFCRKVRPPSPVQCPAPCPARCRPPSWMPTCRPVIHSAQCNSASVVAHLTESPPEKDEACVRRLPWVSNNNMLMVHTGWKYLPV